AELYGVTGRRQRERIDEVLELVGLRGRERERVEGYSRGMRQRLHIARGILHDPEVVFLDEPTIGVDPVGARELRAMIAGLVDAGKTVLLTTHYMFEADSLCDRIAVIARGRIVAEGTPTELKTHVADSSVVEVEVFGVTFRVREFTVSRWFLLMCLLQPVIFATIAFYMFKAGGRPGTLLYAALGAGMMGIWSSTLFGSGGALQWNRWQGTLELLVAA